MIAAVAATFTACNDEKKTETTVNTDTSASSLTKDAMLTDSLNNAEAAKPSVTAPADGDITMKDGKGMIMKSGAWVVLDKAITLSNGTVVMPNGDVKMKDHTMKLMNGQTIKTTGEYYGTDGKIMEMMSNAGEKMQEGADKVKEGAEKVKAEGAKMMDKAGDKMKEGAEKMKANP